MSGNVTDEAADGLIMRGFIAVRTEGGVDLLDDYLPGVLATAGLQAVLSGDWWCREHAGRIIAALVDLGPRGELDDCEVWMQAQGPRGIRIVISKHRGELRLVVNDEERLRTLVDLPLLSGLVEQIDHVAKECPDNVNMERLEDRPDARANGEAGSSTPATTDGPASSGHTPQEHTAEPQLQEDRLEFDFEPESRRRASSGHYIAVWNDKQQE